METRIAQLSLHEEEEEELAIVGRQTTPKGLELSLVGRFLTDKTINFPAMKHNMAKVWRLGMGIAITEAKHGLFLFKFFHQVDLQRVLDIGPWSFDGHLLFLHHLQPGEDPTSVPLHHTPFWVHVYDLPLRFMAQGIGEHCNVGLAQI